MSVVGPQRLMKKKQFCIQIVPPLGIDLPSICYSSRVYSTLKMEAAYSSETVVYIYVRIKIYSITSKDIIICIVITTTTSNFNWIRS